MAGFCVINSQFITLLLRCRNVEAGLSALSHISKYRSPQNMKPSKQVKIYLQEIGAQGLCLKI